VKALRVIAQIDRALCRLYGLRREHRAPDFVTPQASDETTGELLIRQTGEGESAELELSIRLNSRLFERLGQALGAPNPIPHLATVGVAVEEVSHFRYVIERARLLRGVSPFELELQGEIDRFAVLYFWALRGAARDLALFRELEKRCFGEFRPLPTVGPDLVSRYRDAHDIARRIVNGSLARAVHRQTDPAELVARLRRLYHGSLAEKLSEAA